MASGAPYAAVVAESVSMIAPLRLTLLDPSEFAIRFIAIIRLAR
jgi:hypothetical protein